MDNEGEDFTDRWLQENMDLLVGEYIPTFVEFCCYSCINKAKREEDY